MNDDEVDEQIDDDYGESEPIMIERNRKTGKFQ